MVTDSGCTKQLNSARLATELADPSKAISDILTGPAIGRGGHFEFVFIQIAKLDVRPHKAQPISL